MEMYKMYSVFYHLIEELSTEQINAIKKIAKISVDFEDLLKNGVKPPMMDNFYQLNCAEDPVSLGWGCRALNT